MPVEMIGWIAPRVASEIIPPAGPPFDPAVIAETARIHARGEFYRTSGTYAEIRCRQVPHIPVYGGGGSDDAVRALAPQVDVYMLWGEPLRDTAIFMDRVRREAALAGRHPSFSLSTRPILAATDGAAWDRARAILDRVLANRGGVRAP